MVVLVETFFVMSFAGLWKPTTWSGWKSSFYNVYSVIIVMLIYGFTLSQTLDLVFACTTRAEYMDNIFTQLGVLVICSKQFGILKQCDDIRKIRQSFHTGSLAPNTPDELMIQEKYKRKTRLYFAVCVAIYETVIPGMIINKIFSHGPEYELPLRTMLPYDYTSPAPYRFTLVMQYLIYSFGCHIDLAFDTLFYGIMLQLCAEVNILKCRFQVGVMTLQKMSDEKLHNSQEYEEMEKKLFSDWVKNHNALLSLSSDVESVFSNIIFFQYFASSIEICSQAYLLSQMKIFSADFMSFFYFLISVVIEIFMYCTTANQVTVEFEYLSQAMYSTNWFALSNSAKKNIVLIMAKTLTPIVFTSGHIVTLSHESLKALLKMAYSIYSVLGGT